MNRYQEHYRLLGIAPGDSWKKLRGAYKAQMRRWHPDRFGRNEATLGEAEERSKLINKAYRELSEYYEQHGRLPLDTTPSTETGHPQPARSDIPPPVAPATNRSPPISKGPQGRKDFRAVTVAILMLFLVANFFWGPEAIDPTDEYADFSTPAAPPPPAATSPPTEPTATTGQRFARGSTLGEVYAIQGVPTKVEDAVWHYGDARVFFQDGRVFHWNDSEPPRLKVQKETSPPPSAAHTVTHFDKGSSKDEVRAVQGDPLRETEDTWEYSLSRVYFDRNGRVTRWQESPLDPLRVKR